MKVHHGCVVNSLQKLSLRGAKVRGIPVEYLAGGDSSPALVHRHLLGAETLRCSRESLLDVGARVDLYRWTRLENKRRKIE